MTETIQHISPAKLRPSPLNPRKHIGSVEDLKPTIKSQGILQPLVARTAADGGLELVFGHRRLKAAQELGLKFVPYILREMKDVDVLEQQVIENVSRAAMTPLEEAAAFSKLMQDYGYSLDKLSQRVGKSKSSLSMTVRLLTLSEEAQKALGRGDIELHAATQLLKVKDTRVQDLALREIVDGDLTVLQTAKLIAKKYAVDTVGPKSKAQKMVAGKREKAREQLRVAGLAVFACDAVIEKRRLFSKEDLRLMILALAEAPTTRAMLELNGYEETGTLLKRAQKAAEPELRQMLFQMCVAAWATEDAKNVTAMTKAYGVDLDSLKALDSADALFSKR